MRHGSRRPAHPGRRRRRRRSSSAPRTTPTTRRSSRAPRDLPAVASAIAGYLAAARRAARGAVGRRRPAPAALRRSGRRRPRRDAFGARETTEGWTLNVEREDVCPVVTCRSGATIDDYLATLGKKERHEIRRKVRRAEAAGEIRLDGLDRPARRPRGVHRPPPEALGRGRAVPRRRPAAPQSRVFFRRLFELFGAGRAAAAGVPDRRRPADRGRHPFRDAATRSSTTTPASTPTRATCRRAS